MIGTLDRYLAKEWVKVFVVTALGFPLIAIIFELVDRLATYLEQGLSFKEILTSYFYALPEKIILILPAAVLFATVFSVGAMGRHSELIAGHASGRSFHRMIVPILFASIFATGIGLFLVEIAPQSTVKQLEILGERERRAQNKRFNFVYRAEQGWVYIVRSLDLAVPEMRDIQFEREGTGEDYPTIVLQAQRATYDDSTSDWTMHTGRVRFLTGDGPETQFQFDSLALTALEESPSELLAQAKRPEEMRYQELGEYIEALERSGGDPGKLQVDRALKIAIPFTCIIIALFGAPLANVNPRASGAFGVAISLGTTVVFLVLINLTREVGSSGLMSPDWAAWLPNMAFGAGGLFLLARAKT